MRGSVTRLIRKEGCGFILGEDGSEVYFDLCSLDGLDSGSLPVGTWVEYEVQYAAERPRAVDVKAVPSPRPRPR